MVCFVKELLTVFVSSMFSNAITTKIRLSSSSYKLDYSTCETDRYIKGRCDMVY